MLRIAGRTDCHNQSADWFRNDAETYRYASFRASAHTGVGIRIPCTRRVLSPRRGDNLKGELLDKLEFNCVDYSGTNMCDKVTERF